MGGSRTYFDVMEEQDVEEDDRELPDPSDMDDHDEPDLLPCPNCRRMINEDADWCHHCKQYITQDSGSRRLPAMVVGLILLLIMAAALGWLLMR
jgi:hypothetical protein